MIDLNDVFYFVQLVDRGGFTAAGRALRAPKSTLSDRMRRLEADLGVRLLNRSSRRFRMTGAGEDFYRHAVAMLREAEKAETVVRQRLKEPSGSIRCTAAVATMQFGLKGVIADFLTRHPKVSVVAHATDQMIDIVGENYDVAIRAHSVPLPDSTLVQRALAPAPWFLFAGAAYLEAHPAIEAPQDLEGHGSLCMMRADVPPAWRLRHVSRTKADLTLPLSPRLLSDDMIGLKQAAIAGLGIVALPGYVCREEVEEGRLFRVLPEWIAGDSTLTALVPYRRGLLPSVRAFIDHLSAELPKVVLM